MVSIPACHAGDPGSIPGSGVKFFLLLYCSLCVYVCVFLGRLGSLLVWYVNKTKKKTKKKNGYNTALFPGGPPPQYWAGSNCVNFGVRMRTGGLQLIWSYPKVNWTTDLNICYRITSGCRVYMICTATEPSVIRPSGAMDSASDFGSGGWGFESLLGLFFLSYNKKKKTD